MRLHGLAVLDEINSVALEQISSHVLRRTNLLHRPVRKPLLILSPGHAWNRGVDLDHRYALGNGADQAAQVAPDTRLLVDLVPVGITVT